MKHNDKVKYQAGLSMSKESEDIADRLGRIEEMLKHALHQLEDHEARIRVNESAVTKAFAGGAVLIVIGQVVVQILVKHLSK